MKARGTDAASDGNTIHDGVALARHRNEDLSYVGPSNRNDKVSRNRRLQVTSPNARTMYLLEKLAKLEQEPVQGAHHVIVSQVR